MMKIGHACWHQLERNRVLGWMPFQYHRLVYTWMITLFASPLVSAWALPSVALMFAITVMNKLEFLAGMVSAADGVRANTIDMLLLMKSSAGLSLQCPFSFRALWSFQEWRQTPWLSYCYTLVFRKTFGVGCYMSRYFCLIPQEFGCPCGWKSCNQSWGAQGAEIFWSNELTFFRPYCHWDHWGFLCPHFSFCQNLGWRLLRQSGDTKSISYLFQHLSIAVQRGNAISTLGTSPKSLNAIV